MSAGRWLARWAAAEVSGHPSADQGRQGDVISAAGGAPAVVNLGISAALSQERAVASILDLADVFCGS